jgi:hypothetical protein
MLSVVAPSLELNLGLWVGIHQNSYVQNYNGGTLSAEILQKRLSSLAVPVTSIIER